MTPAELKIWQLEHYAKRLTEETRTAAKSFLRAELFRLKQPSHE